MRLVIKYNFFSINFQYDFYIILLFRLIFRRNFRQRGQIFFKIIKCYNVMAGHSEFLFTLISTTSDFLSNFFVSVSDVLEFQIQNNRTFSN